MNTIKSKLYQLCLDFKAGVINTQEELESQVDEIYGSHPIIICGPSCSGKKYLRDKLGDKGVFKTLIMSIEDIVSLSWEDRSNATVIRLDPHLDVIFDRMEKREMLYDDINARMYEDVKEFESFTDFDIHIKNPEF